MTIDDYKREFGSYYAQHLFFDLLHGRMSKKIAARLVPRVYKHMTPAEKSAWRDMLHWIGSDTTNFLLRRL